MRDRLSGVLAATGALTLLAGAMVIGTAGTAQADHAANHEGSSGNAGKVFVCKYVGTPGDDERLQTGDNPISVSVNAIKGYQGEGSYFNDGQGRSYVLAVDDRTSQAEPEPDVSECPPPTDGDNPVRVSAGASAEASVTCEMPGTFTIPATVGVTYLVNGSPTAAGTYSTPVSGTITATSADPTRWALTNPGYSLAFDNGSEPCVDIPPTCPDGTDRAGEPVGTEPCDVDEPAVCPDDTDRAGEPVGTEPCDDDEPEPTEVTPVVSFSDATCATLTGSAVNGAADTDGIDYTVTGTPGLGETVKVVAVPKEGFVFPSDATVEWVHTFAGVEDLDCDEVAPTEGVDVCPNLAGDQESVPDGFELKGSACIAENDVAGVESESPKPNPGSGPDDEPTVKGVAQELPTVKGVAEAIPTAVDAGLGGPVGPVAAQGSLLGQGLVGGGLMLLLVAGWLQRGRLSRGAHQF